MHSVRIAASISARSEGSITKDDADMGNNTVKGF